MSDPNPYKPPDAKLESELPLDLDFAAPPFPLEVERPSRWARRVEVRHAGVRIAELEPERRSFKRSLRARLPAGDSSLTYTGTGVLWQTLGSAGHYGAFSPFFPPFGFTLRTPWRGASAGQVVLLRGASLLAAPPDLAPGPEISSFASERHVGTQVVHRADGVPLLWVQRPLFSARALLLETTEPATPLEAWLGVLCVALQL